MFIIKIYWINEKKNKFFKLVLIEFSKLQVSEILLRNIKIMLEIKRSYSPKIEFFHIFQKHHIIITTVSIVFFFCQYNIFYIWMHSSKLKRNNANAVDNCNKTEFNLFFWILISLRFLFVRIFPTWIKKLSLCERTEISYEIWLKCLIRLICNISLCF